jgi:isoleucyl-tRNA synthetase
MFKEIPANFKYDDLEKKILEQWDKNSVFKKSIKNGKPFVFYEGPPTANGTPGIHHVMARTIKDIITRYRSLKGFRVERKAGWDTHGLPVEIQVEKEIGISGREQVQSYGIEKFNTACRESVFKFKDQWDGMTTRMGYWVDLENPYITCDNNYIESVWWILKELFNKDLIYKGHKIQPYCPKCGTALSSHEVSQGYQDVKDLTAMVRFKIIDQKNSFFLAWTTTPWTLPSNMALAVGPEIDYVKVKYNDEKNGEEYLILAKDLMVQVLGNDDVEIVEEYKGKDLENTSYEPLFNFVEPSENSHKVLIADFVTTSDGTGIVHMAPAYGDDDYRICKENNIPVEIIVRADGTFNEKVGEFSGLNIKIADPEIVTNLKHRGMLFKSQKIEHSYPHCWRHGTPLFYYATDSWFIKTTNYKEKLLKNNKSINWFPPEVGEGRFGNWLENNIDWALSRNRYWGTPLNIWLNEETGEMKSVGSIDELKSEIKRSIEAGYMNKMPEVIDLHKPYVDDIILVGKTGDKLNRTPEVIDCWFDSGAMPFAQWHYPFENKDLIEKNEAFPADFICEGIDQTRGWFYTLLAISTMLFDRSPYKNVIVNNLILDKDGQKMSKSKGNTVNSMEMMEKYGADTLRWFFVTSSQPWISKRFDEEAIQDIQRKFLGTLVNTYAFFALYANVDKFDPEQKQVEFNDRPEIDRWVLSLLYKKIEEIDTSLDSYDITSATRNMNNFLINDVSNWYVRRNRRRFWKSEMNNDKLSAYQTLYEVLASLIKMASPVMPFLTEELYQSLKRSSDPESIHMTSFPEIGQKEKSKRNELLEDRMALAQNIVEMARALRSENQLKIRQPLQAIKVYTENDFQKNAILDFKQVILEELNVKELDIVEDFSDIAVRKTKANFKTLGPKFGKEVGLVVNKIKSMTEKEIEQFGLTKEFSFELNNETHKLNKDDIEIVFEKKEGIAVQSSETISVALDMNLTDSLIEEGIAREFVNRLQTLRKEKRFELTDRISVTIATTAKIKNAIESQMSYIKKETLTETITFNDTENKDKVVVEGDDVYLNIVKNDRK